MPARPSRHVPIAMGIALSCVVGTADATGSEVMPPVTSRTIAASHPTPSKPPPLDLSRPVIRKAIEDSRDPLDDVVPPQDATFGAGGATSRQSIDQGFRRAEIPTCLTPEAYRFDPPQIGPFGLGGYLALPFLVQAIVTGKCRH